MLFLFSNFDDDDVLEVDADSPSSSSSAAICNLLLIRVSDGRRRNVARPMREEVLVVLDDRRISMCCVCPEVNARAHRNRTMLAARASMADMESLIAAGLVGRHLQTAEINAMVASNFAT